MASVVKKVSAGTSPVRARFEIELRRSTLRYCGSHLSYGHLKKVSRRNALTRFRFARVVARTEIVDNLVVVPRHKECLAAQERLVWGREASSSNSSNSSSGSRHIIVFQAGVIYKKSEKLGGGGGGEVICSTTGIIFSGEEGMNNIISATNEGNQKLKIELRRMISV